MFGLDGGASLWGQQEPPEYARARMEGAMLGFRLRMALYQDDPLSEARAALHLPREPQVMYVSHAMWEAMREDAGSCAHVEWYTMNPPKCVACGKVGT